MGGANVLFGTLLVVGGGAKNIVDTLGSGASDILLMGFAKDMHETLGVLWAAFGAVGLSRRWFHGAGSSYYANCLRGIARGIS